MSEPRGHIPSEQPRGRELAALGLAALGIVYGDIGTSPIYALRESFHGDYEIAVQAANVLGILSLIFWSLIVVISVKYLAFVLRADNRGEGGMIALTALVMGPRAHLGPRRGLVLAGLFGAALLYGDSMITPAISVLSAVEGLEVATPLFRPYVIPIAVVILAALFLVQSRGTARVGAVFGPITTLWFLTLATLGIWQIVQEPSVLRAVNPVYAAEFFGSNGWRGFLVLGSVFLVVTGGEALYADIGHFGVRPIRLTWYWFVLPALLLNYFGQAALLLRNPAANDQPFFRMAPQWALYPLVVLATVATVIASQAVISGSFSLTRQAVQLGYVPRLRIEHTSPSRIGQIYIPAVNWALMVACIGLVVGFGTSSRLAAAYGVAVTTDMVFTTILFCAVARLFWRWSWPVLLLFGAFFLAVDLAFWGANLVKIPHGGWFPLVVAGVVFTMITTWKRGREILAERIGHGAMPIADFLASIRDHPPARVPHTAIFMYGRRDGTPPALLHNLKHNLVLHERVVLLNVELLDIPRVAEAERVEVEELGQGFWRVVAKYGFAEDPDVPSLFDLLAARGLELTLARTSFFLSRETLIPSKRRGMAIWREKLFALMSRNNTPATAYFRIP
ncbi:MAG: potassium transporter Kup, partial [Gemmatimonadota bacterium]|nr:potassium transporter Kup [Gemmatimonadota bacterium]